jgi:hypothetical protein
LHIDTFNAAAALARVEERTIHQVLDRVIELRIGAHIGRILTAELQADRGECAGRRMLDGTPALHRAGEAHVIHATARQDARRVVVSEHEMSEQTLRHACAIHGLLEALTRQDGLRGCFQDHRIASNQTRHHSIDRGQKRIVPRRDRENDAERIAADVACEPGLGLRHQRGQRLLRDLDHVGHPLLEGAKLAAVADWAAHLPRQLRYDLSIQRAHGFEEAEHGRRALLDWHARPFCLRLAGSGHRRINLGR